VTSWPPGDIDGEPIPPLPPPPRIAMPEGVTTWLGHKGQTCPACDSFIAGTDQDFREHLWECVTDLKLDLQAARRDILGAAPARPVLTAQQKAAAREEMKAQGGPCLHCGGLHSHACPRVRRVRWDGGKPVEAVYWRDGKWPTGDILFPEEIAEEVETP
jgi:hypothetical protein